MSDDKQLFCMGGLFGFFIGMFVCAVVGSYQRTCAIDAGVAHYTINSKTGAIKFEYITPIKLLQTPEYIQP